jgi:hypothetical protein
MLKVQATWWTCCLFLVATKPSPNPVPLVRLLRVDPSRSWTQWWEWTSPHRPPSQLRIWTTQPETQNIQISDIRKISVIFSHVLFSCSSIIQIIPSRFHSKKIKEQKIQQDPTSASCHVRSHCILIAWTMLRFLRFASFKSLQTLSKTQEPFEWDQRRDWWLAQRVAKVVPRLVGIVENSFGALDFEKSCLFVKRIGNAWFSGFHDRIYDSIIYKSCIQLVFSMLGKDFTSELLKTWSLHLVGVLMLGKDFTSDLLKTWSLHLVGVLMYMFGYGYIYIHMYIYIYICACVWYWLVSNTKTNVSQPVLAGKDFSLVIFAWMVLYSYVGSCSL